MSTVNNGHHRRFLAILRTTIVLVILGSAFPASDLAWSASIPAHIDLAANTIPSIEGAEFGAFIGTNPLTADAVREFEHQSRRHVSSISVYQGWDASSRPSFPASELNTAVRLHDGYDTQTILQLTMMPYVKLKDITNGVYDTYLTSYAKQARNWGGTIRLRFAHEMIQNNVYDNCQGQTGCPEWYPWQDQPKAYVAAFRHVHDIFKTVAATNVEFVWCPNNYPFDVSIVQQYYPGQDYVDWLCTDGYNPANTDGKPGYPDWYWFDDIFYPIYHTFIDRADIFGAKPVMIGEFASCEAGPHELPGQTKSAWITNAFERIKSADYSQIKAFYWFHINKECDWRINSSAQSLSAFQTALADPYFISHPGQTFYSVGVKDGWVLESSETSTIGGKLNTTASSLRIGDDSTRKQYRSILSFQTAALPDTAVITSATLKLKEVSITGNGDPFTLFQGLMVDVRKGFFGTTANLQLADFQAAASKPVGPYTPALSSGWYTIKLGSASLPLINKLSTYQSGFTQFRLRFKLDDNDDSVADFLSLSSGNAGLAFRPQLIIEYRP